MDRNSLLKEIGYKLRKFREPLWYRSGEMADSIGAERTGYSKYEQGKASPQLIVLYRLAGKQHRCFTFSVFSVYSVGSILWRLKYFI